MGDTDYQKELNASYKDASKSPLKKKDLREFNGLDFFKVDSTFIVKAKFNKIENAPTFEMATTTERRPLYKKYGLLNFTLNGKKCELTIYQSQDDLRDEKYKDYVSGSDSDCAQVEEIVDEPKEVEEDKEEAKI